MNLQINQPPQTKPALPPQVAGDLIVMVTFDVEEGKQQQLVDSIAPQIAEWVVDKPGYISSVFQNSLDGTRVINYSRWASSEAFAGFACDPRSAELMQTIKSLATKGLESRFFQVSAVIGDPTREIPVPAGAFQGWSS